MEKHINVAKTLINLAETYAALGDNKCQKKLAEQALSIIRSNCGLIHPHTATALAILASACGGIRR